MRTPFAVCLQCDWVRVFKGQAAYGGRWRALVPERCPHCGGEVDAGSAAHDELGYLAQRVARSVRNAAPLDARATDERRCVPGREGG